MGLLTIKGIIRVKQFWPAGRSDADTVTVELGPQKEESIVFVDDAGRPHPTRVLDIGEVSGAQGREDVIKVSKAGVRKITIRLQGLDAPELHYQPQVKGGKGIVRPFRQSLGETSSNELKRLFDSLGEATVPCEVLTSVSRPSDVCDVFGRVVGNVVLINGGSRIDINHWLLREGWALPGLYNSMSKQEIRGVLADHETAKQHKRGLFSKKVVTSKLAPFNPKQVERKGPASFKPLSDLGPVNFPKFFRRQAEHFVRRAIDKNVPADLVEFIEPKNEPALQTDRFLKLRGSTIDDKPRPEFKNLANFLRGGVYPLGPELVFWEKEAKLFKKDTKTEMDWDD